MERKNRLKVEVFDLTSATPLEDSNSGAERVQSSKRSGSHNKVSNSEKHVKDIKVDPNRPKTLKRRRKRFRRVLDSASEESASESTNTETTSTCVATERQESCSNRSGEHRNENIILFRKSGTKDDGERDATRDDANKLKGKSELSELELSGSSQSQKQKLKGDTTCEDALPFSQHNGEKQIDVQNNCENLDEEEDETSAVSSSSSESLPDIENPLDELLRNEYPTSEKTNAEINDTTDVDSIPTCGSKFITRNKKLEISIQSGTEFSISIFIEHNQTGKRIPIYPQVIRDKFLALPSGCRRFDLKMFFFKTTLQTFNAVKEIISPYWEHYDFDGIENVISALSKYNQLENEVILEKMDYGIIERAVQKFPNLRSYQKECILFAYRRQGRCILADASGMGKRAEAILSCYLYEDEWPVMIICSTSQQDHWESELKKWLPKERKYRISNIQCAEDCADIITENQESHGIPDFTIIGYTLLQNEANHLKTIQFKVVIIDESHKIKHSWTATTKSACHIIKRSKRRILLTSNPAFGVPDELFYQLCLIDKDAFKNSTQFADRYCGFETRYDKVSGQSKQLPSRNWRNAKNLAELKHLLYNTVMIRHFKSDDKDVRLPIKERELVKLNFQPDERTKRILEEIYLESKDSLDDLCMESEAQKKARVFVWYKKSGKAKMNLICKYLDLLNMKDRKIIIYARHLFVLEGIQRLLERKRIGFVKICGDYENRQDLSDQFNSSPKIHVALLNMTISQVGVDLTTADCIIYAELYWLPDSILRNEDRAWEFFQSHSTRAAGKVLDIKYLIACDSEVDQEEQIHMDLHLWEMLQGKTKVLEQLGLMSHDFTSNIPEVQFEAVSSSIVDDLNFSDISSNESDHEYDPDQEDSDDESEVDTSDPPNSIELSNENDSPDENQNQHPLKRDSENSEISEEEGDNVSNFELEQSPPSSSESEHSDDDEEKQPPRRITRSQIAKKPKAKVDDGTKNDDEENESDDQNDSSDENEGTGSSSTFVVTTSTSEESEKSEKEDLENSANGTRKSTRIKTRTRNSPKTKKQKSEKNRSASESDESDGQNCDSTSSDDSVDYEIKVKKARKAFISS